MSIVDTSPKVPLYLDLYRKLRQKIESGEYPVGSRIPSEKEISEENGVSRITSKHALEQLVNEGFIKRFPGKGTFVQSCTGYSLTIQQAEEDKSADGAQKLIGVLMEGISSDFGGDLLMGVEQRCAELGYSAIVKFSFGDEEREIACINELIEAGVEGILLMCVYSEVYSPAVMKLALEGFPLIFMDRGLKGLPIPFVGTNHLQAAREMTDDLLRSGHTHLALVMFEGSYTTSSAEDRVNGYVESCLAHDLFCGNKRVMLTREGICHSCPAVHAENVQKVREFLRQNPETTAFLALSARVAVILLEAVADSNIRIIASFDGPQNSFRTPCELVYVVQDQLMIGSVACEQLVAKINKQEVPAVTYVPHLLPNPLV